ncbi:hypothetical protein SPHINGOAX6_70709 [Sphingomonas sp. AX6]|nr:hypothetical protein SPHINGOAX6_70709 [Sphingomonas sp. AX6]
MAYHRRRSHSYPKRWILENGGRTWARTKDPLIKSQLLYQLSYASIRVKSAAPMAVVSFGSARLAPGFEVGNRLLP